MEHGPGQILASDAGLLSRRQALTLGGAALGALAAGAAWETLRPTGPTLIGPGSRLVAATDERRTMTGRIVTRSLTAGPGTADLGGRTVQTWLYDEQLPGPLIRLTAGDRLRLRLTNHLPERTATHWHGLAIRNDMDGVPGVTMPYLAPQTSFDYDFVVPHPGTYWYHSHVGLQLDRGLYGPLIVDAPDERGDYDAEAVLVLDDWLDGTGTTPAQTLKDLKANGMGGMGGMAGMGAVSSVAGGPIPSTLGGDPGDVRYPFFLMNGRLPTRPTTIVAKAGQRLRLRLVNAGGDTAFRVAVGGHPMTVTHADGYPVQPVNVDALLIGMGERYDVVVQVTAGAFPIVAYAEGKGGVARAVLRSSAGAPTPGPALPAELRGRLLSYRDLRPTPAAALAGITRPRLLRAELTATSSGYRWLINGRSFGDGSLKVRNGDAVRLTLVNRTGMFHPMHLHGHTFALTTPVSAGARKDTVIVRPARSVTVELAANNPGQWMLHCHNAYHQEAGMMTTLAYTA